MRYALVIVLKVVEVALATIVPWWIGGRLFPEMPLCMRWMMGGCLLTLLCLTVMCSLVLVPRWWRLNCRWVDSLLCRLDPSKDYLVRRKD